MPLRTSIMTDVVDLVAQNLFGGIMRLYDVAATSESAAPAGLLIAQITIPNPSHNAGSYSSSTKKATASMRSTWQDNSADAAGTFRGYTVTNGAGQIVDYGTVGIAGSGADIIVNSGSIAQGANFSIIEYTLEFQF